MKRIFILLFASIVLLFSLSGCYLVNGLFLSDEAKDLVGLWQSGGWDVEDDNCYWDFRADGRVFVTEWTHDLETFLIPNHFNYSVSDGYLKLSQYAGIAKFDFEITEESDIEGGNCYLQVEDYTGDFDYDRIDYYNTFHLIRRNEYSDEARAVRALYEEVSDE